MRYLSGIFLVIFLSITTAVSAQNKVVIGVGEITSSIYGSDPQSFQTMLETQLAKTNKFSLIERNRMTEILKEQSLGETDLVDATAQLGGITGVDYLIYGTITKYGEAKSGTVIGGIGVGKRKYEMSVDLRIVDSQTGEITLAETVSNVMKSGSSIAVMGIGNTNSKADPLSDVQRLVARDVVSAIVTNIYPPKVIKIQKNGTYILNYGNSIFAKGDFLRVFEVGESFVDPDTGEELGAEEIEVGLLQIKSAAAKFSKAKLVKGTVEEGNVGRKLTGDEAKQAKKDAKKSNKRKRL